MFLQGFCRGSINVSSGLGCGDLDILGWRFVKGVSEGLSIWPVKGLAAKVYTLPRCT